MNKNNKLFILLIVYSILLLALCSCSMSALIYRNSGPPVLSQDELVRPYVKLGRIQATREVLFGDYAVTPDIQAWGLASLQNEAEKLGADAVILYEVNGRTTSYGLFPSTEYRATGFAIKFK